MASESSSPELATSAPRLPRFGLASLCGIHCAVFVIAALNIGWRWSWAIAGPCLVLAALHLATALLSVMGSSQLARCWRWTAWCSLGLLAVFTWMLLRTALFVSALYEGLGQGIAAALLAVWGLVVLVTLPVSCWGFGVVGMAGDLQRSREIINKKSMGVAAFLGFGVAIVSSAQTWLAAQGSTIQGPVDFAAPSWLALSANASPVEPKGHRFDRDPIQCSAPLDLVLPTAFVLPQGKPAWCIQKSTVEALVHEIQLRAREALAQGPVSVDVVLQQGSLRPGDPFDSLKLRPGLDGVCSVETCLLPWQLLVTDTFSTHQPLPFLKDFRFGVAIDELPERLQSAAGNSALTRITTQHVLLKPGNAPVTLRRLRAEVPVTEETLRRAAVAAERHILDAQLRNGTFRYLLNPDTGKANTREYSLARQAGTTLALCESNTTVPTEPIRAALRALSRDRKTAGKLAFLKSARDPRVRLASNTLPLAAFVACRSQVGDEFDSFIAGATRFLLEMQRPDGGFFPHFDVNERRPLKGAEPLFSPGQAILALTLLHDLPAQAIAGLPPRKALRAAAERAMDYVANEHWAHPLYDVFFIEENWHCIAARAAQHTLAHRGYEQFCFDYVAFRSQSILDEARGPTPELDGGMGVGRVVPPHNTGTAGFAEALAAAISVKKTRQLDTTADEAVLRRALGYLLRQQWSPDSMLFAATPSILGAISEHPHQMVTRIDFVQHAWSALAHGSRVLHQGTGGS